MLHVALVVKTEWSNCRLTNLVYSPTDQAFSYPSCRSSKAQILSSEKLNSCKWIHQENMSIRALCGHVNSLLNGAINWRRLSLVLGQWRRNHARFWALLTQEAFGWYQELLSKTRLSRGRLQLFWSFDRQAEEETSSKTIF